MTSISTQEEYKLFKREYLQTIKKSGEWERSLERKYTEEQELDIIDVVSYLDNRQRGFGRLNDEQHYNSICSADVDKRLRKEAKIGFEFAKKCFLLRTAIKRWSIEHKNSR